MDKTTAPELPLLRNTTGSSPDLKSKMLYMESKLVRTTMAEQIGSRFQMIRKLHS